MGPVRGLAVNVTDTSQPGPLAASIMELVSNHSQEFYSIMRNLRQISKSGDRKKLYQAAYSHALSSNILPDYTNMLTRERHIKPMPPTTQVVSHLKKSMVVDGDFSVLDYGAGAGEKALLIFGPSSKIVCQDPAPRCAEFHAKARLMKGLKSKTPNFVDWNIKDLGDKVDIFFSMNVMMLHGITANPSSPLVLIVIPDLVTLARDGYARQSGKVVTTHYRGATVDEIWHELKQPHYVHAYHSISATVNGPVILGKATDVHLEPDGKPWPKIKSLGPADFGTVVAVTGKLDGILVRAEAKHGTFTIYSEPRISFQVKQSWNFLLEFEYVEGIFHLVRILHFFGVNGNMFHPSQLERLTFQGNSRFCSLPHSPSDTPEGFIIHVETPVGYIQRYYKYTWTYDLDPTHYRLIYSREPKCASRGICEYSAGEHVRCRPDRRVSDDMRTLKDREASRASPLFVQALTFLEYVGIHTTTMTLTGPDEGDIVVPGEFASKHHANSRIVTSSDVLAQHIVRYNKQPQKLDNFSSFIAAAGCDLATASSTFMLGHPQVVRLLVEIVKENQGAALTVTDSLGQPLEPILVLHNLIDLVGPVLSLNFLREARDTQERDSNSFIYDRTGLEGTQAVRYSVSEFGRLVRNTKAVGCANGSITCFFIGEAVRHNLIRMVCCNVMMPSVINQVYKDGYLHFAAPPGIPVAGTFNNYLGLCLEGNNTSASIREGINAILRSQNGSVARDKLLDMVTKLGFTSKQLNDALEDATYKTAKGIVYVETIRSPEQDGAFNPVEHIQRLMSRGIIRGIDVEHYNPGSRELGHRTVAFDVAVIRTLMDSISALPAIDKLFFLHNGLYYLQPRIDGTHIPGPSVPVRINGHPGPLYAMSEGNKSIGATLRERPLPVGQAVRQWRLKGRPEDYFASIIRSRDLIYCQDSIKTPEYEEAGSLPDQTNIYLFFGKMFPLSNMFPTRVRYKDVNFKSSEHAYQFSKAVLTAPDLAASVLAASDGFQAKKLLKKAQLTPQWLASRIDTMRAILDEKFKDPDMEQALLDTGELILAEANPADNFWGIGRSMGDPYARDPSQWQGANHMGNILMKIRDAKKQ